MTQYYVGLALGAVLGFVLGGAIALSIARGIFKDKYVDIQDMYGRSVL